MKYTSSNDGRERANVRATIRLERGEVALLKKLAERDGDESLHCWLSLRLHEGIQAAVHRYHEDIDYDKEHHWSRIWKVRCRAAIAALKEITEVQYAPLVDGRKRKAKTTNLPEILPPAGGLLTCDDCGATHPGKSGARCPELGPHPENGKHTGYLK